jgi:hypothetical protein
MTLAGLTDIDKFKTMDRKEVIHGSVIILLIGGCFRRSRRKPDCKRNFGLMAVLFEFPGYLYDMLFVCLNVL